MNEHIVLTTDRSWIYIYGVSMVKETSRMMTDSSPLGYKNKLQKSSLFCEMDLLDGIQPVRLASLFNKMELRTYPAGNIIFTPGDSSCEQLYILKQGQIDIYRLTYDDKVLVTRQILPGSVFGIRGLLIGRNKQNNFAEAIEDSNINIVSREKVLNI